MGTRQAVRANIDAARDLLASGRGGSRLMAREALSSVCREAMRRGYDAEFVDALVMLDEVQS